MAHPDAIIHLGRQAPPPLREWGKPPERYPVPPSIFDRMMGDFPKFQSSEPKVYDQHGHMLGIVTNMEYSTTMHGAPHGVATIQLTSPISTLTKEDTMPDMTYYGLSLEQLEQRRKEIKKALKGRRQLEHEEAKKRKRDERTKRLRETRREKALGRLSEIADGGDAALAIAASTALLDRS